MRKLFLSIIPITMMVAMLGATNGCSESEEATPDEDLVTDLHAAFAEFDTNNTDIYLDGSNVVIETNGLPNHKTVYWGVGHALYQEEPGVQLTPSIIPNFNGAASLTVSALPKKATSTTATSLGAIGIAISGAYIYNDQEGNGALNQAASSLDFTGGHIGPGQYHYHLETKAWTNDDENLVGIMADGFFLYGRKCYATGDHPTDLDDSGGHTSITQHNNEEEYHYHIENELYLNQYYLLFAGRYQGTPNRIN